MPSYQSPRGTQDILPDRQPIWRRIRQAAHETADKLGYLPITLPTYEELGLFQRSIGSGTDIIDKELFLVRQKNEGEGSEQQYALRPEGTAGMVRAFIEHGMHTWPQPVRLYSIVNNFRYDRPQKGRYREHNQFDIEYFGDKGPFADAWVIFTTWQFLRELGLSQSVVLHLNSLGTREDREQYSTALKEYLRPHLSELSTDSQYRFDLNPLRILDSKDPMDQETVQAAPQLADYLSAESTAHAAAVEKYLKSWEIPFIKNHRLVRGLDYYCHTAFEWTVTGEDGQQSSLGGGGRYDGLLTELGGPDAGGVGAGMGLERLMLLLEKNDQGSSTNPKLRFAVVSMDAVYNDYASTIVRTVADAGYAVTANFSKNGAGSQLKSALRSGATHALIVGEQEMNDHTVQIKDLQQSTQETITVDSLLGSLSQKAPLV